MEIIKTLYHRYWLEQEPCPDCNNWADFRGLVRFTGKKEYKCPVCNKYFEK